MRAVSNLRAASEDTPTRERGSGAAPGAGVSLPQRWRLQREIGRGGQAEVWLALAHHVSGEVAGALGDAGAAAEHYRQAARIAPRCWFGRPPKTT